MHEEIERLREKIARLEEAMEKDHFSGLFDKGKVDKDYKRMKKLKKELEKLEKQNK